MALSSYKSIKQKYIDTINVTDLTEANGYSLSWGNINGYRAIYNWNNGVFDITDAKYNSETYSAISSYIASNYGNKKDEFSISDVIWYVYKRQSDGYHIDGYVSTYITYDPNYGENLATVTGSKLRYNTKATIAENPFIRNDGYAFAGWSTSENGEVVYKPGDTIENLTSKLTLYAQWTDENVYEVTFKYGYDNGNNTDVFHYENGLKSGSKLTNVPEPERDGYDFSGWKDEDGIILTSDQRIAMTDEPDVLGASRDASKDDAAVLGERRYSTGDNDFTYKYLIIIIAAGLIITQLYFGFGKKQSDK